MDRSAMIRAGIGAVLIGAGLSLMMSAASRNCIDAGENPEEAASKVASASAEMSADD